MIRSFTFDQDDLTRFALAEASKLLGGTVEASDLEFSLQFSGDPNAEHRGEPLKVKIVVSEKPVGSRHRP